MKLAAVAFAVSCLLPAASCLAADYSAEIVGLKGKAQWPSAAGPRRDASLHELLRAGDSVHTGPGAHLDLALDGRLNNLIAFEEGTEARIESLHPAVLSIQKGELFLKLTAWFDGPLKVRLPSAVVHGQSDFRVTYRDEEVVAQNFTSALVTVYVRDEEGKVLSQPFSVTDRHQRSVAFPGDTPQLSSISDFEEDKALKTQGRLEGLFAEWKRIGKTSRVFTPRKAKEGLTA